MEDGQEGYGAGYVQLCNASDDDGDESDTEGWATPEVTNPYTLQPHSSTRKQHTVGLLYVTAAAHAGGVGFCTAEPDDFRGGRPARRRRRPRDGGEPPPHPRLR